MHFQFICCTETLWTFIANIWLHAFMSLYVSLNVTFVGEFLLTNVTCEPSAFIVWLYQMCLEFLMPHKLCWTVSTWERLCTSVNTNMTLHFCDCRKLLSTIRTWMRSYVAVYTSFVCTQVAGMAETFVTHWTLIWLISSVILKWMDKWLLWLNALSHSEHLYGLSAVWTLMCSLRFLNRFPQTEHSNGFSPEWLFMCVVNLAFSGKHFPHSLHLYLPLCMFTCRLSCSAVKNHFSHWSHG